jgi:hypothetical protein
MACTWRLRNLKRVSYPRHTIREIAATLDAAETVSRIFKLRISPWRIPIDFTDTERNFMGWRACLGAIFYLRMIGESPSLMVYLPFHLLGVIGGARMRTVANNQLGKPAEKRRGYKRVAHLSLSPAFWFGYHIMVLNFPGVRSNWLLS